MRKKCIKFLTFSIISLLCCVIFSNATSAIEVTIEAEPTGNSFETSYWRCTYLDGTYVSLENNCVNPKPNSSVLSNIKEIRSSRQLDAVEGYYYRAFLEIKTLSQYPEILWKMGTNNTYWDIVSWRLVSQDEVARAGEITGLDQPNVPAGIGMTDDMYATFYEVVLRAKSTGKLNFYLGNNRNALVYSPVVPTETVYIGISTIDEFKPSGATAMNEKDDEDRDNIESQSSQTDSDSESSSEDATSTGTTLLGAFSSFISAITSASPSNCNLDMDLGNLDLGVVNLCQLSLPQPIPTIASIFLILFCVPLSISTARKVINLFRSFQ